MYNRVGYYKAECKLFLVWAGNRYMAPGRYFGLGYWGVGTKNYKTGAMLGLCWGGVGDWGYAGEALGVVEYYFGLGYLGDAGEEMF